MTDYNVTAIFSANVSKFKAGVREVLGESEKLKRLTELNAQGMGSALQGLGKGLTVGLTLPIGAVGGASAKMAMEFESSMAGVRKTTDLTDAEFAAMEQTIRDMSKQMPASANEIARVVEAAGQLGIEKDNMADFAKVMIDLGESTNISSDEAASALARLANITQMPQTEFDRLGSVIVDLGNNFATTESEIVNMGMRLAGTGNLIGLSEAQIMALATSMTSVGINAEAGGSAFSRVMQKMNTAVVSGGAKLEGFAKVSGMSAEEFAAKWQSDPQDAITAFVKGLGRAQDSGDDIITTLKDLGINGIRETDTLQRLAGAGDLMSSAFETANTAWEENTALAKEAGLRYETMESQMAMAKNTLTDAGITIGKVVAPMFVTFAKAVARIADAFANLSPGAQKAIIAFAGILAAAGPVIWILGTLMTKFKVIADGVRIFGTALKGAKAVAQGAATGVGLFGKAIAFLASPIGIAVAAIAAIVGVIIYLWKTNEGFRNAVIGIWEGIKSAISSAVETIKTVASNVWESVTERWAAFIETAKAIWTGMQEFFSTLWERIKTGAVNLWSSVTEAWSAAVEGIKTTWNNIVTFFANLWESIKTTAATAWGAFSQVVMGIIGPFVESIQSSFARTKEALGVVWENIKTAAAAAWELIKNVIIGPVLVLLQAITGDWEGAKSSLIQIWDNIKAAASTIWESLKNTVKTIVTTMVSNLKSMFEGMKQSAMNIWNALKSGVIKLAESIKTGAINAWEALKTGVVNAANALKTGAINAWNTLKTNIANLVDNIKTSVTNGFDNAKTAAINAVTTLVNRVKTGFTDMLSKIRTTITQLPTIIRSGFNQAISAAQSFVSSAIAAGRNLIMGFVTGVKERASALINSVKGAIGNAIQGAKNLLGIRSPSRVFMKFGQQTDEGFAKGIERFANRPVGAMENMVGNVVKSFDAIDFDLSDRLQPMNASVSREMDHIINDNRNSKQPMELNFTLGQRQFRAFVEDISSVQGKDIQLEELYGF